MTIAIALKVGDGVVLGADSASTLVGADGEVINVYFNAEKIVDLRKDLRVGLATYGLGSLAGRSITTHVKDLRLKLASTGDPLSIDKDSYKVEEVVERIQTYLIDGLYRSEWPMLSKDQLGGEVETYATMGFLIAGYSAGVTEAEVWNLEVQADGTIDKSKIFGVGESGVEMRGQPEAIHRLAYGWSPAILRGLVSATKAPTQDVALFLDSLGAAELVQQQMPLQDAIDLVSYLCEVTAGFVRFLPGHPTVHPPIDIASINFHEGFRWVRRKHYFSPDLNPPKQ